MHKYFTWSSAGTTQILAAAATNKRYRIIAVPMSANEETGSAIVHEGQTPPVSGGTNIVDFVDSVRRTNDQNFSAPYLTQPKNPVFITTVDSGGTTSGKGMIIYLEESITN